MVNRAARFGLVASLMVGGLLVPAAPAEAALVLRLSDGITTVTLADQGADDLNPAVGAVTFVGPVGGFALNVSTGVSKPIVGPAELDLNSINVLTTGAGGTLSIELTDTDYTFGVGGAGLLDWLWGGTATHGSTVTGQGWKNLDNEEFGMGPITTGGLGPFSGAFSTSGSVPHGVLDGAYAMTIQLLFTATSIGQSYSGDFNLQNVPEPAELLLFSLGLLGVGFAARRRQRSH